MTEKGLSPRKIADNVNDRDWNRYIRVDEILSAAALRKQWSEEDKKAKDLSAQKRKAEIERLIAKCDARYNFNLIRDFFKRNYGCFIYNPFNELYIKSLCFYFSNDPRFETELGFSFKKGLWIVGNAGLGKTKTLQAFEKHELYPLKIYNLVNITDRVKEIGSLEIDTSKVVLLDDVGTEQAPVKYFGTEINWFEEFIQKYYMDNKTFSGLIVTTNLGGSAIEQKYGYRVRSRIREMFNQIQLNGTDLRK